MMSLTLDLALNTHGSDPVEVVYAALAAQHPSLNLTPETTLISTVIAHPTKLDPDRTRLVIKDRVNPNVSYAFFYKRTDINRLLANPVFTEAELTQAIGYGSLDLLTFIGEVHNLNLTPADFYVENAGITYTGGAVTPNWRLKSRFDSLFFYGELVVHLHGGGSVPGEPPVTGDLFQLFPTMQIAVGSGNYYSNTTVDAALGKTLTFEPINDYTNWMAYFSLPDKYSVSGDMPPEGAEYRILNNTDKPLYLNMSYYNTMVVPWGMNHFIETGHMVRVVYLGTDPNTGYMTWTIIGDLVAEQPQ